VESKARDESPSVDDSITGNFTLLSLVLKQIQSMALRRVTDGGDEFLVAGAIMLKVELLFLSEWMVVAISARLQGIPILPTVRVFVFV
jgi:hypothetical protein